MALDTSKAFDRGWHADFLHKRKSYGISGQIYGLVKGGKRTSSGSGW